MNTHFILALFQHGYKARTSTLYYLLKGKRTTSVLLYGFLFENLRFFNFSPELQQHDFNNYLEELYEKNFLEKCSVGEAKITIRGNKWLEKQLFSVNDFPSLNNYRYGKTDEECWRLLQFSVQVVSHLSYNHKDYIPLEQSPIYQVQIKHLIKNYSKIELIKKMKDEWFRILSDYSNEEAAYIVKQFSGYQQIGRTTTQLLENYEAYSQIFIKKDRLHKVLNSIETSCSTPLLKQIIAGQINQNKNFSMSETQRYINSGMSLEEISQKRKIKMSTIHDHLLELALNNQIKITDFLSSVETCTFLDQITSPYQEWNYQQLKKECNSLNYLEFRLYQIKKILKEREI